MTTAGATRIRDLADQILTHIRTGEFAPGSRLRQEALAEQFSVSRTPIREALRILETQGFVRHLPNQGAIVRVPEPREIRDAYQVRAELEGLAAELATEWITDADIERLRAANDAFVSVVEASSANTPTAPSKTGGPATWVEANDAFHDIILASSGNDCLRRMISELHGGLLRPVMLATVSVDGRRMRENVAQHAAIMEAIERHDATEARRQMAHHIKRSGELMVRWLENSGSESES